MGDVLNKPFVSEAYDRLMEAQQGHADESRARLADPVDTADKLRAARAGMDMTQAALAAKLGCTAPQLSNMENGEPIKPYFDYAIRFLLMEHRQ